MRRWLLGTIIVLLILLILIPLGGWLYLRTSLPKTTGDVTLAGLDGRVEIVRDAAGVPHIFASTDADAYFALGYVHAQDRMWQMEFQRRIGQGRLSEVLGDATLGTDKFMRTLGIYRASQAGYAGLDPESKGVLDAYAAGVNAWLGEGHTLPVEFTILGVEPGPWQPADSLVWSKLVAYDLGGNFDTELLQVRLLQVLGPERTAQLMPNYPQTGVTILAAQTLDPATADSLLALDGDLQIDLQLGGLDVGSNNWVVAGTHTDTGLPLLANDPHLGSRIPSIWYLAELQGESIHVSGATFPGLPGVASGHNDQIAWGVTNLGPDVQDLYLERVNPANLNQYEVDGQWVDMEIVEELIYIGGQEEPVRWAARSTRHGPLLSDVSGSTAAPVALRWTALDPADTTIAAFLNVGKAADWDEFTQALKFYVAPSQNFVYADKAGNIGYYSPGRIPLRVDGHDGMTPVPGWASEYEWQGWIPFEEMPHVYNPEVGFVVTANNKAIPADYPYFVSNEWAPPYRAQRITDMILEMTRGDESLSLADMAAIQGDQTSLQVRELLPLLLAVEPGDERQAQALTILREWNGAPSTVDSAAAAIYMAWYQFLGPAIFEDDLSRDLFEEMALRSHHTFLADILAQADSPWCDNVRSFPNEDCGTIAQEALDVALDDLTERMGDDMTKWQWGEIHFTYYPHNPFTEVSPLNRIFDRQIANGGDTYTVNVAPVRFDPRYEQRWVPSYRHLIDLADLNASLFMHTTGQSGNFVSPHYDDLIERHQAVEYLPMTWGRENVDGDVLVLEPK